jgi:hypothetical protein
MLSPVEALKAFRFELVMDRRRFVDRKEIIGQLQAEIDAIDHAIADEENIQSDIEVRSHVKIKHILNN